MVRKPVDSCVLLEEVTGDKTAGPPEIDIILYDYRIYMYDYAYDCSGFRRLGTTRQRSP